MASLFDAPGEFLPKVSKKTASILALPTLMRISNLSSFTLYILITIFIVFVVFMLYGTRINWAWFEIRPRRWIVNSSSQHYWKPMGIYRNLQIPAAKLDFDFKDEEYTMTLEILLENSRNYWTEDGPYRHIAHRGSHELIRDDEDDRNRVITKCNMTGTSGNLPPFGLPARMNPGILLDPTVNDILVFIDTSDDTETFRESVRIRDIPLDIPVRLGIIVNKNILEVYLNCKLEVTKLLSHRPKKVENHWYGSAGPAPASAQIQNLYLWNRALPSSDIRYVCPPITRSTFIKMPPCPDAPRPDVPDKAAADTMSKKVNIGFGEHVRATCSL